jgi:hypothetical protein
MTPDSAPGSEGFRCYRVSTRLQTRSRCRRALSSPCAPWHRTCHLTGKGFGVTTCPVTLDPPPGAGGSGVTSAPWHQARYPVGKGSSVTMCPTALDPPPSTGGLWCRHVPHGTGPTTQQGRAPVSPCVLWLRTCPWCERAQPSPHAPWLSASEVSSCVPKKPDIRHIMASPGMRSKQHIKYVEDKPCTAYS